MVGLWGEEVRWRGSIAAANINQPPCTFHTSTVAVGGPGVHLPRPLTAIPASNDAFSRVTCKTGAGAKWSPVLKGGEKKSNYPFKTLPYPFQC